MANPMIGLSPSGQTGYSLAQAMLQQSMQPEPIRTHLQGFGKLAQALSGAYRMSQYDDEREGNLAQLRSALASPEGLASPDLVAALMDTDPMAAIGLAGQNRAYGLQEQAFDLERQEFEREQAIREQLFGGGGMAGGIDNPYAAAAALEGDYGPAATAWQNQPGTYQGTPGSVPMTQLPDQPGPGETGGTMIPPEQPTERTPQMVGRAVYEGALGFYGADVVQRYVDAQGGMPGIDGNDPEEWALGLHVWLQNNNIAPAGGTRSLLDIAQGVPTPDTGPTPLPPPGYQAPPPAPSYADPAAPNTPPQAQQQPQGPPQGAAYDRSSREFITTTGPDGRQWYVDDQMNPLSPTPQSSEERREIEGEVFQRAQGLADDFRSEDAIKEFGDIQRGYANIATALETGAGDLTIVFSFMKMQDPGSTVREGEQATAANAPGVEGWVRDSYNNLLAGRAINATRRAELIEQAQVLYNNARQQYDGTVDFYTRRATEFGIDPQLVIPDNLIEVNQTDVNALIDDLYSRMPELPRPGGR